MCDKASLFLTQNGAILLYNHFDIKEQICNSLTLLDLPSFLFLLWAMYIDYSSALRLHQNEAAAVQVSGD